MISMTKRNNSSRDSTLFIVIVIDINEREKHIFGEAEYFKISTLHESEYSMTDVSYVMVFYFNHDRMTDVLYVL